MIKGIDLIKIELEYNDWGKPNIINDKRCFNISHSGEYVAVAIDEKPVGIDIEKVEEIDLTIAKSFFSSFESNYIFSLPQEKRRDAFFKLWTLKEAFIKAKGKGLHIPLNSFTIDISNDKPILYNTMHDKCKLSIECIDNDYFVATCVLHKI